MKLMMQSMILFVYMSACMRIIYSTHIYTQTHTYMYIRKHTCEHTNTHTKTNEDSHAYKHTQTPTNIETFRHTCKHTDSERGPMLYTGVFHASVFRRHSFINSAAPQSTQRPASVA